MSAFSAIIGTSTVIRHVQHLVLRVAEMDTPVLISGEPGSGKELVARAIHEKSNRAEGPFTLVKCGSIGEDLLEAELFGNERDAFPGAQGRQGRMELANGGIIYLDEVSKLTPRMQAALLKVIQDGTMVPVGGTQATPINVRVICSSTVPLEELVKDRVFREDLYYRIASCAIFIPPLRDRREDIPALVDFFVQKYNGLRGKNIFGISPDAMTALLQHNWSYNVRELENLVERIVVLKNCGSVEVCDLPPRIRNLVTDNIDKFYEKTQAQQNSQTANEQQRAGGNLQNSQPQSRNNQFPGTSRTDTLRHVIRDVPVNNGSSNQQNMGMNGRSGSSSQSYIPPPSSQHHSSYEEASEIDNFIKKEIDLGSGIDFYRVVEEFENRLIAEALRRTNHNKNRAAQLLAMNRTTLVEKLKKRSSSTPVKMETPRTKKSSAYTIFDGLGTETASFETYDFVQDKTDEFPDRG